MAAALRGRKYLVKYGFLVLVLNAIGLYRGSYSGLMMFDAIVLAMFVCLWVATKLWPDRISFRSDGDLTIKRGRDGRI